MKYYSFVKMFMGKRSETLPSFTHTALSLGLLTFVTLMVALLNVLGVTGGVGFGLILSITGGIGGNFTYLNIRMQLSVICFLNRISVVLYNPGTVIYYIGDSEK